MIHVTVAKKLFFRFQRKQNQEVPLLHKKMLFQRFDSVFKKSWIKSLFCWFNIQKMLDIIKQIDVKYLTQLKRLSKQTKTNKTNKQTNKRKQK